MHYQPVSIGIWMFPKIGVPQNGWFIMENPIKMDDLGVPPFSETPYMSEIYRCKTISILQNHGGLLHFLCIPGGIAHFLRRKKTRPTNVVLRFWRLWRLWPWLILILPSKDADPLTCRKALQMLPAMAYGWWKKCCSSWYYGRYTPED